MDECISVVLPTYNGQKYIGEAIESILNQTYANLELIIVNDCSLDATKTIVEDYARKDNRIRIIHNAVNKKLPASLNIGFQEARGQYLTWTSDDNRYKPNALQVLKTALDGGQGYDLVFSNYDVIDENGNFVRERICMKDSTEELLYGNIVGASFLYKRKVQEELGGYAEDKFLVEDYDFWLRVYQKFTIGHIGENLYEYRIHGGSLTKTRMKQIAEATIRLWEELLRQEDVKEEIKYRLALNIAEKYHTIVPDFRKRVRYMKLARKYGPCAVEKILIKEWLDKLFGTKEKEHKT